VGIVLVRDEDVFVERAVRNVAGFCDELLLLDHGSQDATRSILERLSSELAHARFEAIADPARSHEVLKRYISTDTWVFGVDGDELYDPAGLARFRPRLEAGEFDRYLTVKGIQLHCRRLDLQSQRAEGWLAPPSRSTTKLFNFAAIESWDGDTPERFHGGELLLNPGRTDDVAMIRDEATWDDSAFRCLHVCFLQRSSRQDPAEYARRSYIDRWADSRSKRAVTFARRALGRPDLSTWKLAKYTQGDPVTASVAGFFPSTSS
jgi:hypothetical protein